MLQVSGELGDSQNKNLVSGYSCVIVSEPITFILSSLLFLNEVMENYKFLKFVKIKY